MLNKIVVLSFFSLLLISCSDSDNKGAGKDAVVAQVGESRLYKSDIEKSLGSDVKLHDLNVKIFTHNWVRNQVVLQKANNSLTEGEKDFSKELKDYRNTLLRYFYESKIVNASVDTVVSNNEVLEYYQQNSKNFELKENFVKVRAVRMSHSFKDIVKRKAMFNYSDSLGKVKYDNWVEENNLETVRYDSTWVRWESFKEQVPIKTLNDESFLAATNYREFWGAKDVWILKITGYRLKDNISPIELVTDKIKRILINQRKVTVVKNMEEEVYNEAVQNGDIKLFLNK